MEPNKFEETIKRQLQDREIQPSQGAWQKLSERLEATPVAQDKKHGIWWGIAAALIGLLVAGSWFWNTDTTETITAPAVVTVPQKEASPLRSQTVEKQETQVVEETVSATREAPFSTEKNGQNSESPVENNTDLAASPVPNASPEDSVLESISILPIADEGRVAVAQGAIDKKVSEVIALVEELETVQETALTDAEVDSLLKRAQNELLAERKLRETYQVDAHSLLADVEDELDESFRDQIFGKLKTGFLKVRTAVADRNN
ncbi:hypothetical protein [Maribacter sp. 2-571]|uniref:hypothetical protein n=1 Tax=Maribacter sp. 2-571 TaxID=3417569 RepID=UPI003D34438D